jgi:hypothetical protein
VNFSVVALSCLDIVVTDERYTLFGSKVQQNKYLNKFKPSNHNFYITQISYVSHVLLPYFPLPQRSILPVASTCQFSFVIKLFRTHVCK